MKNNSSSFDKAKEKINKEHLMDMIDLYFSLNVEQDWESFYQETSQEEN